MISFKDKTISELLNQCYHLKVDTIERLSGYDDANYCISDSEDGKKYLLKIINQNDSCKSFADIVCSIMQNLHTKLEIFQKTKIHRPYSFMYKIPELVKTYDDGKLYFVQQLDTNHRMKDDHSINDNSKNIGMLFEFLDGKTLDQTIGAIPEDEVFIYLGMIVSKLSIDLLELSEVQIISDLFKARSSYRWSLSNASSATQNAIEKLENYLSLSGNNKLEFVNTQLMGKIKQFCLIYDDIFTKEYLFRLGPMRILHGDLNMRNFITCDINYLKDFLQESNYENDVPALGIIDWQDIQVGPRIFDLAIFITYVLTEMIALKRLSFDSGRIGTLIGYIKFGYELVQLEKLPPTWGDSQLSLGELEALIKLITIRLCQSVCLAQIGLLETSSPKNSHIVDGLVERIELLKSMLEYGDERIENNIIWIVLQVDQSLTMKKDIIRKKYLCQSVM